MNSSSVRELSWINSKQRRFLLSRVDEYHDSRKDQPRRRRWRASFKKDWRKNWELTDQQNKEIHSWLSKQRPDTEGRRTIKKEPASPPSRQPFRASSSHNQTNRPSSTMVLHSKRVENERVRGSENTENVEVEMSQVQSGIERRQVADASPRVVHPPINIESIKFTDGPDTIDLCRMTFPVPGFTMKEISLKVIDGCLDIRAEKLSPDAQDEEALKFSWCVPNFTLKRVVSLPHGTLPHQVRASLDKAIVTVTYPRYAKPWDVPLETPGSEPSPLLLTQGDETEGPTAASSDSTMGTESFKFKLDDASRIERRASV